MSKTNGNGRTTAKPASVQEAVEVAAVHGPIGVKDGDAAKVRVAWRAFESANLRLAGFRRQYLIGEAKLLAEIAECEGRVNGEVELLRRAHNVPDGPGWTFDTDRLAFTRQGALA